MTPGEEPVYERLKALGIVFERHEHAPAATVEDAERHWGSIDAPRPALLQDRDGR